MQQYKIYQIIITREEADQINSMKNPREDHAKYRTHTHAIFDEYDEVDFGFYEHSATIFAENLNRVFEIGNIGPDSNITYHGKMHSISVGDVIIDEDGNFFGVARFGFKKLKLNTDNGPVTTFEVLEETE